MKNTCDFSNVKVGDKLWSIQLGDCVVYLIYATSASYPIHVKNELGQSAVYSKFGKEDNDDAYQSLYFSNPMIVAPEEPVRLPDLKVDDKVIVWDNDGETAPRYFSHFTKDGKICCFSDGATSFSVDKDSNGLPRITIWDNYEIVVE